MLETSRAKKWLYTKLAAATGLTAVTGTRIYDKQAPQNAVKPYVIFAYQGGDDLQGLGTTRSMARPLFLVKMVGAGPLTEAQKDAADFIDTLIGTASGDVADGFVFHARRTQEIDYTETNPSTSERIDHLGGLFQVWSYPQ